MTFVLVHGGGTTGGCWELLLPLLDRPACAVDLPGRGHHPADLASLTLSEFADCVAAVIVERDLIDVVLVGHSLAGITLPRVADRVSDRLRRLVFISCAVPAQGDSVADILATFSPTVAQVAARIGDDVVTAEGFLHPELASAMLCNDMDERQQRLTLSLLVPEALQVVSEPMDLSGLRHAIPITYVRLLRDQSLTPATQDRMAAHLGATDIIDLDAGHMAMISQPEKLAAILNRL
jgi:pimeloyl-ACP methyl ester carboxylesterase